MYTFQFLWGPIINMHYEKINTSPSRGWISWFLLIGAILYLVNNKHKLEERIDELETDVAYILDKLEK